MPLLETDYMLVSEIIEFSYFSVIYICSQIKNLVFGEKQKFTVFLSVIQAEFSCLICLFLFCTFLKYYFVAL